MTRDVQIQTVPPAQVVLLGITGSGHVTVTLSTQTSPQAHRPHPELTDPAPNSVAR